MGSHEQLPRSLSLVKLQWMEAWVDVSDKQIFKAYPRPIGTKWVDHYLAHQAKRPSAISRMYDRTFDLLQAAGLRTDSGGDEGIVPITIK